VRHQEIAPTNAVKKRNEPMARGKLINGDKTPDTCHAADVRGNNRDF
jgi:hypothetical protein